jgi:regulatory protein YycH of two-component signal transduction system YycFG
MGMNKEIIKSAILAVLIIISLFFTWNMWSLQPAYEEFENQTFVESIPITPGETRELYEVIKPQQLFFHTNENHYSTLEGSYLNNLWVEMQEWEYSNESLRVFTKEEFKNWIHGKAEPILELRFYDEIPMETMQSMIKWDDFRNEIISFDRIYLNVANDNDEQQKVYFVSYEKMKIVETTVPEASHIVSELYSKRDELLELYFSFQTGKGNEIILPENQVNLSSYQYFTEEIDGEKFKDALFSNPRIVKQDVNSTIIKYTDGTRVLNIYPNGHLVNYVNPTLRDTNSVKANILIEQSIAFLNDHGGWTDDYVLFDISEKDQAVKFIMSIHSIPVIYSTEIPFGPTMISQIWGQNEIAEYERPLYQLLKDFPGDTKTLISGRKVVEIITDSQQIDETEIKNIYIAYELGGSDNQQFVKISPVWCIEMNNGKLLKINEVLEKPEGDENGLE